MEISEAAFTPLVDIQATKDERNIAIDKVGVRNVEYPIVVLDRAREQQHTIGTFQLTVDLPHHFKGTHMSRFLEVLSDHKHEVSVHGIPKILQGLREKLDAERAHLEVRFPFFMCKKAPVTGKEAMMAFECGFDATLGIPLSYDGNGPKPVCQSDFEMIVKAPVTTLCPCSKEIADRGAHNQRGIVSVRLRTNEHVWLEEIIEMIEACASCALFPLLKRPDEKWVTEHAYDNPRFVEDMVREVALVFDKDPRITTYEIEVENEESIHAHNAYAYLKREK